MDLIPINLKSNEMALKNCVYLPSNLAKDPNSTVHVKIKNRYIKCMFSSIIDAKNVGASKNLREFLGLDLVNPVHIEPAEPLSPEKYGILHLTLELTVRKNA